MSLIYHAIYVAIFLGFIRKVVDKVRVPFMIDLKVEHNDDSDEFYVLVNDIAFYWTSDLDDAKMFIYSACSRCRSLCDKLKIVETSVEFALMSSESIPGLTIEERSGLDQTVDEFE